MYADSSRIGLHIELDGCEEATFDPSSISNGCWDQKLARAAAWCGGLASRQTKFPWVVFSKVLTFLQCLLRISCIFVLNKQPPVQLLVDLVPSKLVVGSTSSYYQYPIFEGG